MRRNESEQSCAQCAERLFSTVAFCPYCGAATADADGRVAATATARPSGRGPDAPERQPGPVPDAPNTGTSPPAAVPPSVPPRTPQAPAAGVPAPPPAPVPASAPSADATKAAAESAAPAPATPAGTATKAATADTAPPAPVRQARRTRRTPWVLLALAGLGWAGYWQFRGVDHGPCREALSASARALSQGDAAGGRRQAVLALGACSGDDAAKARVLQGQADQALAVQAACERALQGVASQLDTQRLLSARKQLDGLDARCTRSDGAAVLRQRLEQAQRAADSSADSVRKQLVLGDTRGAQASLDRLQGQNREHAELPALRAEVRAALAAQRPAPAPVPPAPRPVVQPPPGSTPATPPLLVQDFLRQAERALAQSRFDAARTYVDSALRIDPSNAQAGSLLRRIQERELQVLREETTIR
ncbi:hypothetical protein [Azohydromonas australica]|uniref:hypothetical protein n=1 Tax=Azohydromonas australica TaxID=364039 RepID=UPI000402CB9D|nr:hypothetical protein [Azohydromonas australica]